MKVTVWTETFHSLSPYPIQTMNVHCSSNEWQWIVTVLTAPFDGVWVYSVQTMTVLVPSVHFCSNFNTALGLRILKSGRQVIFIKMILYGLEKSTNNKYTYFKNPIFVFFLLLLPPFSGIFVVLVCTLRI